MQRWAKFLLVEEQLQDDGCRGDVRVLPSGKLPASEPYIFKVSFPIVVQQTFVVPRTTDITGMQWPVAALCENTSITAQEKCAHM